MTPGECPSSDGHRLTLQVVCCSDCCKQMPWCFLCYEGGKMNKKKLNEAKNLGCTSVNLKALIKSGAILYNRASVV